MNSSTALSLLEKLNAVAVFSSAVAVVCFVAINFVG
jgi:hypothetical protein